MGGGWNADPCVLTANLRPGLASGGSRMTSKKEANSKIADDRNKLASFSQAQAAAACLLVVVPAGNFSLFDYRGGLNWALFMILLGLVQLLKERRSFDLRPQWRFVVALVAINLPMVEYFNTHSFLIGVLGTLAACFAISDKEPFSPHDFASKFGLKLLYSFVQFPAQLFSVLLPNWVAWTLSRRWMAWVLPLAVGVIFIGLFTYSSPLWARWFAYLFSALWEVLISMRVLAIFWLCWFCFPYFFNSAHRKERKRRKLPVVTIEPDNELKLAGRLLLIVNMVFAVQTVTDARYLWVGVKLPEGVTYASYAHNGAYVLGLAVCLAGALLVWTMRERGPGEKSPVIRWLNLIWVFQIALLLIFASMRLQLYIDVYSLTILRMVACIVFLLIAFGLGTIVWRFLRDRTAQWLVLVNVFALGSTTYLCAFVNFDHIVATYNLSQGKQLNKVDFGYICSLGAHALPELIQTRNENPEYRVFSQCWFPISEHKQIRKNAGFLSWGFRNQRLIWKVDKLKRERAASNQALSP